METKFRQIKCPVHGQSRTIHAEIAKFASTAQWNIITDNDLRFDFYIPKGDLFIHLDFLYDDDDDFTPKEEWIVSNGYSLLRVHSLNIDPQIIKTTSLIAVGGIMTGLFSTTPRRGYVHVKDHFKPAEVTVPRPILPAPPIVQKPLIATILEKHQLYHQRSFMITIDGEKHIPINYYLTKKDAFLHFHNLSIERAKVEEAEAVGKWAISRGRPFMFIHPGTPNLEHVILKFMALIDRGYTGVCSSIPYGNFPSLDSAVANHVIQ